VSSQLGIVITTKKDDRTESPVPWQDCLVIEEGGGSTFSVVDTEPENRREHGPFGHKEAQPLRFVESVECQMKAYEELLGGTYLTRLTRDLLVALDLESGGHIKSMRKGEQRGVGDHAPATFCTRDLAPVPLHLDFPGVHAILTDGGNGITGESATVLVVLGGIEGHSAGGTLEREERYFSN
jgi:hypothetical protein